MARQVDGQCNRLFLDPVLRGSYPDDVLASFEPISGLEHIHDGDAARHRGAARRARDQLLQPAHGRGGRPAGRGGPRQLPARAGLGRRAPRGQGRHRAAEDGDGLGDRPDRARRAAACACRASTTGPPLYVTENGAAFADVVTADGEVDDADRVAFLDAHLRAAKRAIDRGRRPARLLRLVAARQLRMGVGLRPPLRDRPRRLRHPGSHGQGERSLVRSGGRTQRDRRGVARTRHAGVDDRRRPRPHRRLRAHQPRQLEQPRPRARHRLRPRPLPHRTRLPVRRRALRRAAPRRRRAASTPCTCSATSAPTRCRSPASARG